jgi:DNA-directed RNA polymerase specialized sigma24 family protein
MRRSLATITQESFEALLDWLDPDREVAGQKYEIIRKVLLRIFVSKGFSDAEHLVDRTINVVTIRLPDIRNHYQGEKVHYFRGVARNIIHDEERRKEIATGDFPERVEEIKPTSEMVECLRRCVNFLTQEKRELILDYHLYEGQAKIEIHREMAHELAISENALRSRAHHIRAKLEACVLQCMQS